MVQARDFRITFDPSDPPTTKAVRDAQLIYLDDALEELAPDMAEEGREAIARIRAARYSTAAVKAEVERLTSLNFGRVARVIGEQVQAATRFADAYSRATDARMGVQGRGAVRARVAREAALETPTSERPKTPAQKTAGRVLTKDRFEVRELSTRLHESEKRVAREAYHGAARAVVDGGAFRDAGKRLIGEVQKGGATLAGNQGIPRLLQDLKAAGDALAKNANSPALQQDWQRSISAIERYQKTLATQGRTQAGYLELIERARRQGPAMVDKALDRWLVEKQRYNAERIIATEAQAAYRSAQWLADRDKPWVTGYKWKLQRSARADYEKRTKPHNVKSPGGGKSIGRGRCVCEVMNGREFSKDAPQEFPQMGHPHCRCWWEPIIDHKKTFVSTISEADRAWLDKNR